MGDRYAFGLGKITAFNSVIQIVMAHYKAFDIGGVGCVYPVEIPAGDKVRAYLPLYRFLRGLVYQRIKKVAPLISHMVRWTL